MLICPIITGLQAWNLLLKNKGGEGVEITKDQANELYTVLDIIAAEFKSDPMSVQCFDLRIVDRAKKVIEEIRELNTKARK